MKDGDVVLVSLPQMDGQRKPRPEIVLRSLPPFGDFLVCGVSSQLRQEAKGFDELITGSDADFSKIGLRADSLIRLGFPGIYTRSQLLGSIGEISTQRHGWLVKRLADFLVAGKQN